MIIPGDFKPNNLLTERQLNEDIAKQPASAKYPLAAVEVDNTTTTILAVPSGEYWCLDHISAHNPDGTATPALTFYYVPDGGTAGTANEVAYKSFAANESLALTALSGVIFGPGDKLQAVSSISDTINVYGGVTRVFSGS